MVQKLPQHVAIIMDGNGRWAKQRGLLRLEGHKAGVLAVKRVVEACLEKKIPILSLFAFSSENWSRPISEVNFLMELFIDALHQEVDSLLKQGVTLRFTGCLEGLSDALKNQMQTAALKTIENQSLILNVVVNYGGKWDITQALKKLACKVKTGEMTVEALTESVIAEHLSMTLPDPDLFIRTSGEQRLSNFFLWQLAYTELYFTEVLWPDFTQAEFNKALENFALRERRYGSIHSI